VRKQGEDEIRNLRDQDPQKFLGTLTREMADEGLDSGSRQMACIIFKNFILSRSQGAKYVDYWLGLPADFRSQVKEAILAQLNSHDNLFRRAIANVVASIASLEIPRGEWHNLIEVLCTNAEHTEYNVRLASLTTLGYICEEISPESISS
jgi:importin subunit beta-1